MSEQPTQEPIPEPVRELLAAIADTLDVPAPAPTPHDQALHALLLENRVQSVQTALRDVLAGHAALGLTLEAEYLRHRAARLDQVAYRTREQHLAVHERAAHISEENTR